MTRNTGKWYSWDQRDPLWILCAALFCQSQKVSFGCNGCSEGAFVSPSKWGVSQQDLPVCFPCLLVVQKILRWTQDLVKYQFIWHGYISTCELGFWTTFKWKRRPSPVVCFGNGCRWLTKSFLVQENNMQKVLPLNLILNQDSCFESSLKVS